MSTNSDPCEETYRGQYAFSEPETLAVKNFIEKHPEIKIAYNYHSYGNFFIIPYSFMKEESDKYLEENNNSLFKIYKDFEKENIFPVNNKFGNTVSLLNYTSDGEASDWMLGEKGILAFSPELGNKNFNSETFYPDISTVLDICRENFASAMFGIQKSAFSLKFNGIRGFNSNDQNKNKTQNYNNDDNFFWAFCDDFNKNISKHSYEFIDTNRLLDDICKTNKYKKIYSIIVEIENEGLKHFDREAIIKISFNSRGGIKRIIGSLIKFDYSASTITKLSDIFDSDEDYKDKFDFSYSEFFGNDDLNKTLTFERNFNVIKIESNNTIFLDLKLLTDNNDLKDIVSHFFDLKIEFIYEIDNKIIRNRVINELNNRDFHYFLPEKNLILGNFFDKEDSIKNYIILNNYSIKSLYDQIHITILIILVLILVLLTFTIIKIIKKEKLNKNKESPIETIVKTYNTFIAETERNDANGNNDKNPDLYSKA